MKQPPFKPFQRTKSWRKKFAVAARGVTVAVRTQNSFAVHLPIAVVVLAAGFLVGMSVERFMLLMLAVAAVLVAELLNTSIECLARAITDQEHSHIRDALDIAGGAVLVASGIAVLIGLMLFGVQFWELSTGV